MATGAGPTVGVGGAASARAALSAADRVAPVDGRATVALGLTRLLTGGCYVVLVVAVIGGIAPPGDTAALGGLPQVPLALALLALVAAALLDTATTRWVGVTPDGGPRRERWLWVTGWFALVVGFLVVQFDPRAFLAVFALGVVIHAAVPALRWWRDSRHASGTVTWPAGAETFALLSVLARVESITPDRLLGLAALPPVAGDRWLDRLRSEGSVFGGRRRHWVVGDERVGLTVPGRERLALMRSELERLAGDPPAR